jgi:hypothetical protein
MMRSAEGSLQLPPLPSVAAALRAITEHLAREVASPSPATPDWSEFEWRIARAVAVMHGISGLLAEELLWPGPDGWAEFLSQQHEHIARRQLRLHELLIDVGERCQRMGIPVQALKGAALHLEGIYRHGQRPMADLDLLTSPQHAAGATKILESLGFRESHRSFKHRVFEPHDAIQPGSFGEHAANAMKIELHERICEPLPHCLTDISHWVWPQAARPGLNPYPSPAALMAHLLLHAGGGISHRWLRLVQLKDIALLARRLKPPDWQELLDWRPWWAWPALELVERYCGLTAPAGVMAALRASCPPILRSACVRQSLSDVSLSRLWVEAFPGIEWAQTVSEALTLVARRIVPGADIRSDRRFALATDPSLVRGEWVGLSQSRVILRALRARTPRPWPLYNVRAALGAPR